MKTSKYSTNINGKQYDVLIIRKRQRNIYFRFKDGMFVITAPYIASEKHILSNFDKIAIKLLSKVKVREEDFSFENDYVYLLGEKVSLKLLGIQNIADLQDFLKNLALETFTDSTRKYEQIMGIEKPYKIHVKNTKAQLGSNSKQTHSISYQIRLIHYSKEILESVVVHELAHEFERNHQKSFYDIVYKYCPNYDILTKKIKKGIRE